MFVLSSFQSVASGSNYLTNSPFCAAVLFQAMASGSGYSD